MIACIASCGGSGKSGDDSLQLADDLENRDRIANEEKLYPYIKQIALADTDKCDFDRYVRNYYLEGNNILWIKRQGIRMGANSLINCVGKVETEGLSREKFYYSKLKQYLKESQTIDLENRNDSADMLLAHLEYFLTKSFIRYSIGMRFGFVRPAKVLNRLDLNPNDTTNTTYVQLFDIPVRTPKKRDYVEVMHKIVVDSVKPCLYESVSKAPLYVELRKMLEKKVSRRERKRLLCNMERCRWRLNDSPFEHEKYVIVNLPSQLLIAVDGETTLSMRIGCGANETKTPLLTSEISRVDFNPEWIIPSSIVKKSILPHVGDETFMERHNYYVRERKTGKAVDSKLVTTEMLSSGEYRVVQRGGKGNALGRVIFRFNNNFSVFLHDTSSPSVFERDNRCVSHGCIRVERPFDLAVFMLADKDEKLIDKIDYTMNEWHSKYEKGNADATSEEPETDRSRYLGSLKVNPPVPLFITYYTIYPDENNVLRKYNDIYGYDEAIYTQLKQFLQ